MPQRMPFAQEMRFIHDLLLHIRRHGTPDDEITRKLCSFNQRSSPKPCPQRKSRHISHGRAVCPPASPERCPTSGSDPDDLLRLPDSSDKVSVSHNVSKGILIKAQQKGG